MWLMFDVFNAKNKRNVYTVSSKESWTLVRSTEHAMVPRYEMRIPARSPFFALEISYGAILF